LESAILCSGPESQITFVNCRFERCSLICSKRARIHARSCEFHGAAMVAVAATNAGSLVRLHSCKIQNVGQAIAAQDKGMVMLEQCCVASCLGNGACASLRGWVALRECEVMDCGGVALWADGHGTVLAAERCELRTSTAWLQSVKRQADRADEDACHGGLLRVDRGATALLRRQCTMLGQLQGSAVRVAHRGSRLFASRCDLVNHDHAAVEVLAGARARLSHSTLVAGKQGHALHAYGLHTAARLDACDLSSHNASPARALAACALDMFRCRLSAVIDPLLLLRVTGEDTTAIVKSRDHKAGSVLRIVSHVGRRSVVAFMS
jgi:hypothetical protein